MIFLHRNPKVGKVIEEQFKKSVCERVHIITSTKACYSDTTWGEFAEGVALGVQEERLSNVVRVPTTLQEQSRIGECGESSC